MTDVNAILRVSHICESGEIMLWAAISWTKGALQYHGLSPVGAKECKGCEQVTYRRCVLPARPRARSEPLLDGVDDVGAGLRVVLQFQEAALLRFEQQLVEGTEDVRAFIEAGVPAFNRLFHQRTADRIVLASLGA